MTDQSINALKVIATGNIFDRLGEQIGYEILEVIKFNLNQEHSISVDAENHISCSLYELNKALRNLIGPAATNMIFEDIYAELEKLSEIEKHWHTSISCDFVCVICIVTYNHSKNNV